MYVYFIVPEPTELSVTTPPLVMLDAPVALQTPAGLFGEPTTVKLLPTQ